MVIKFWGTRGSIPVPGKDTIKYGGNTSCIQVITDNGENIILDCGTGIRSLGNYLVRTNHSFEKNLKIFISHTHWDHIQGLPFFLPFFQKYKIDIYINSKESMNLDEVLNAQMHEYFFPVNPDVFSANINFHKLDTSKKMTIDSVDIEMMDVNHSAGTISFKLSNERGSIIYMTDNEILYNAKDEEPTFNRIQELNGKLIDFCKGTDYLIHDSMYLYEDFKNRIGWGHSNNKSLSLFSILADVKNLILFHYEPDYNDDILDKMVDQTKEYLQKENSKIYVMPSYESLEIVI
ncbi:MAG: MBL fold metallo-hydrolase [Bacteroidetes bacterium]|nr:MBL fold metallo-hydrolase [Bacteroidota bacterium]MBU1678402.1 MBL fold metallo-hydrolase [Bacteroidota bacterium]